MRFGTWLELSARSFKYQDVGSVGSAGYLAQIAPSDLLEAVLAYETGNFDVCARQFLALADVGRAYRDALRWTEETAPHLV